MCVGLAFDAVCCAGLAACNVACCCCKSICKTTFKQQVRLAYIFLILVCFLISIFALYGAKEMFMWFNDTFGSDIGCPEQAGGDQGQYACFGISSLYRMSFTLLTMFVIILGMLFTRGCCAKAFNEKLWSAKILYIISMYIICFFIPNSFFQGYVLFAQIMGAIFLIFQSIMLIDIFYFWGQGWVAKYHEGYENYKYFLIIAAVILYGGTITLQVLNFIWFTDSQNVIFNVINCVLVVALTGIQVAGFNKYGSLITSGAISLYITFLTFSAMLSIPNANGKSVMSTQGAYYLSLSIGLLLIIIVLFYMTFVHKQHNANRVKIAQESGLGNQVLLDETEEDIEDMDEEERKEKESKQKENLEKLVQDEIKKNEEKKKIEEELNKAYQNNQYIIFHIVMIFTSVYGCMLISNWADPDFNNAMGDWEWQELQASDASYYCKLICSWATSVLYIWTLIAPSIFPDRDFS